MPVLISTDHTRELSGSPGANVEAHKTAHKTIRVQSHPVELVLLSNTAAREKAIMTRLILSALSGTIFAVAAIFYDRDRLDSSWMAQLLAGGVYHRFHRFDRVHMEGLRTILAGAKFAQSIELIESVK